MSAYRDGILSSATPKAAFGTGMRSFADGSLGLGVCGPCGMGSAGRAYRDGVLGEMDTTKVAMYGVGALVLGGIAYMVLGKKKGRRKG